MTALRPPHRPARLTRRPRSLALGAAGGVLTLASALLAVAAQAILDAHTAIGAGLALLGFAAVAFAALQEGFSVESLTESVPAVQEPFRWPWALAALALGGAAYTRFGGNRFTWAGALLLAAGGLCLAAAIHRRRDPSDDPQPRPWSRNGVHVTWYQVALLGVMGLGAFYRLWRIAEIPAEMGCDLPHNYFNILDILRGRWPIFFPSYPGREGLFFYLAAIPARFTGLSHTSIKVAGALVGVATLPVIYLLGKELFSREVGLYAALLLSVSHWHTIVCRTGYRAATLPLILGALLVLLLRAFRTGNRGLYAWAGVFLGLGFYTYNAFMIAPLAIGLVWLAEWLLRRGRGSSPRPADAAVFGIAALLVMVPLARYVSEDPAGYVYRASTRLTAAEVPLPANLLSTFANNLVRALGMFNVRGDSIYTSNVPYLRQLGFFAAPLFALGLAYAISRWRQGRNAAVLIVLAVMLLPTALSLAFPDEVPGAMRAIGTLLPALLLAGLALALLRRRLAALLAGLGSRGTLLAGALVAVILGAEACALYPVYFNQYVAHLPDQNASISLAMARVIDAYAGNGEAYIMAVPYWYDGNAIRAQLRQGDLPWEHELAALAPGEGPLDGRQGAVLVIVHPADSATLDQLRHAFPRGVALAQRYADGGVAFYTFYGER